jgi:uncharacterized protein
MRRLLVVANRTLGGLSLLERIRSDLDHGGVSVHVLVPVPAAGGRGEHEQTLSEARGRLGREMERLGGLGVEVDGEVVDAEPYEATLAVLDRERFDELIVCTLPPGMSRWLGQDLVARLQRDVDVTVTHLTAPAGWPAHIHATAVRLSIYVGESDRHQHHPLYSEIVRRARAAGLAGATVLRGVEGFGASSVIHTARLLTMSEDLPMVVVIVDAAERIERFLPELDELITEGLVVREDVEVIKYVGRRSPAT